VVKKVKFNNKHDLSTIKKSTATVTV